MRVAPAGWVVPATLPIWLTRAFVFSFRHGDRAPLVPKAPGAGGIAAALRQSVSQANPDSCLPTPSNTNTVHMNGSNFRRVPSPPVGPALHSLPSWLKRSRHIVGQGWRTKETGSFSGSYIHFEFVRGSAIPSFRHLGSCSCIFRVRGSGATPGWRPSSPRSSSSCPGYSCCTPATSTRRAASAFWPRSPPPSSSP